MHMIRADDRQCCSTQQWCAMNITESTDDPKDFLACVQALFTCHLLFTVNNLLSILLNKVTICILYSTLCLLWLCDGFPHRYSPGDVCHIQPKNLPDMVEEFMSLLSLNPCATVTIGSSGQDEGYFQIFCLLLCISGLAVLSGLPRPS